jgi:hypothetical protein
MGCSIPLEEGAAAMADITESKYKPYMKTIFMSTNDEMDVRY